MEEKGNEEDVDVVFKNTGNHVKKLNVSETEKTNLRQVFSPAVKIKTKQLLEKALAIRRKERTLSSHPNVDDENDFSDFKIENHHRPAKPNATKKLNKNPKLSRLKSNVKSENESKSGYDSNSSEDSAKIQTRLRNVKTANISEKETLNENVEVVIDGGELSKKCHICGGGFPEATLKEHLQDCMKEKFEHQKKGPRDEAQPIERIECPVCGKELGLFGLMTRTEHINKCIDQVENKIDEEEEYRKLLLNARSAVMSCPMCGKKVKTDESRTRHLKQCAQANKMSVEQVRNLISQQKEEYHNQLDAGLLPQDFRPPAKQTKLKVTRKPSRMDDDLQLGMTLSTSMLEFQKQDNNERFVMPKKSTAKSDPGKKPKQEKSKSLLLSLSKEEASERISEQVSALIFNKSPQDELSNTPSFKHKKKDDSTSDSLWSKTSIDTSDAATSFSSSVSPSSSLSSMSSSSIQYYVSALMPAVSVSTVAPGSKLRRCSQIPGRGKSLGPKDVQDNPTTSNNEVGDISTPCVSLCLSQQNEDVFHTQTVDILAHLAQENDGDGDGASAVGLDVSMNGHDKERDEFDQAETSGINDGGDEMMLTGNGKDLDEFDLAEEMDNESRDENGGEACSSNNSVSEPAERSRDEIQQSEESRIMNVDDDDDVSFRIRSSYFADKERTGVNQTDESVGSERLSHKMDSSDCGTRQAGTVAASTDDDDGDGNEQALVTHFLPDDKRCEIVNQKRLSTRVRGTDTGNTDKFDKSDDLSELKLLSTHLLSLVNNPSHSDLTIRVKGDGTVKAHKNILSIRCPKLFDLCFDEGVCSVINLQNHCKGSVEWILRYIYGGVMDLHQALGWRNEILDLAQRFCLDSVVTLMQRVVSHHDDLHEESERDSERRPEYSDNRARTIENQCVVGDKSDGSKTAFIEDDHESDRNPGLKDSSTVVGDCIKDTGSVLGDWDEEGIETATARTCQDTALDNGYKEPGVDIRGMESETGLNSGNENYLLQTGTDASNNYVDDETKGIKSVQSVFPDAHVDTDKVDVPTSAGYDASIQPTEVDVLGGDSNESMELFNDEWNNSGTIDSSVLVDAGDSGQIPSDEIQRIEVTDVAGGNEERLDGGEQSEHCLPNATENDRSMWNEDRIEVKVENMETESTADNVKDKATDKDYGKVVENINDENSSQKALTKSVVICNNGDISYTRTDGIKEKTVQTELLPEGGSQATITFNDKDTISILPGDSTDDFTAVTPLSVNFESSKDCTKTPSLPFSINCETPTDCTPIGEPKENPTPATDKPPLNVTSESSKDCTTTTQVVSMDLAEKPRKKGKRVTQKEFIDIIQNVRTKDVIDDDEYTRILVKVEQVGKQFGQTDLDDSIYIPSVLHDASCLDSGEVEITEAFITPKRLKKRKRIFAQSLESSAKKQKMTLDQSGDGFKNESLTSSSVAVPNSSDSAVDKNLHQRSSVVSVNDKSSQDDSKESGKSVVSQTDAVSEELLNSSSLLYDSGDDLFGSDDEKNTTSTLSKKEEKCHRDKSSSSHPLTDPNRNKPLRPTMDLSHSSQTPSAKDRIITAGNSKTIASVPKQIVMVSKNLTKNKSPSTVDPTQINPNHLKKSLSSQSHRQTSSYSNNLTSTPSHLMKSSSYHQQIPTSSNPCTKASTLVMVSKASPSYQAKSCTARSKSSTLTSPAISSPTNPRTPSQSFTPHNTVSSSLYKPTKLPPSTLLRSSPSTTPHPPISTQSTPINLSSPKSKAPNTTHSQPLDLSSPKFKKQNSTQFKPLDLSASKLNSQRQSSPVNRQKNSQSNSLTRSPFKSNQQNLSQPKFTTPTHSPLKSKSQTTSPSKAQRPSPSISLQKPSQPLPKSDLQPPSPYNSQRESSIRPQNPAHTGTSPLSNPSTTKSTPYKPMRLPPSTLLTLNRSSSPSKTTKPTKSQHPTTNPHPHPHRGPTPTMKTKVSRRTPTNGQPRASPKQPRKPPKTLTSSVDDFKNSSLPLNNGDISISMMAQDSPRHKASHKPSRHSGPTSTPRVTKSSTAHNVSLSSTPTHPSAKLNDRDNSISIPVSTSTTFCQSSKTVTKPQDSNRVAVSRYPIPVSIDYFTEGMVSCLTQKAFASQSAKSSHSTSSCQITTNHTKIRTESVRTKSHHDNRNTTTTSSASPLSLRERLGLTNPFGDKPKDKGPEKYQQLQAMSIPSGQGSKERAAVGNAHPPNPTKFNPKTHLLTSPQKSREACVPTQSIDRCAVSPGKVPKMKPVQGNSATNNSRKDDVKIHARPIITSKGDTPTQEKAAQRRRLPNDKIPSPFTPMAPYDDMNTPELKKAVCKVGVRPMGKKRMRDLLKHIYTETHQYETDTDGEATPVKRPKPSAPRNKAQELKDISGKKLLFNNLTEMKNNQGVTAVAGTNASRELPIASAFRNAKGEKATSVMKSDQHREENRQPVLSKHSSSLVTTDAFDGGIQQEDDILGSQDSSFSDGPDLPEESILQVFPEEDDMDVPCTQLTQTSVEVLNERLMNFLRDNPEIYERILMYEALELDVLKKQIAEAGIRVGFPRLQDFLDERCITFSMKNINNRNNQNNRQRQPKKKRNSPVKRNRVPKDKPTKS